MRNFHIILVSIKEKVMNQLNHSKCTLLIALFLSIYSSNAQSWDYKDSGTSFLLYDLAIPDGQSSIAYAAGAQFTANSDGIIIKTTDGGETWNTIYPTSGTIDGIEKIDFVSETKGYVVGYDLFKKTIDGGASWTDIVVAADVWVYKSLTFYDENIGIVTVLTNGSGLEAYITNDSGDSWTPIASTANLPSFAVDYGDATTLYAVGADQVISKSTDGGNNWVELQSGIPTFFNLEVDFKDADNGVVSGEDGDLLTTGNGGVSWDTFTTGYHNFYGLRYKGDEIFAAGTDQDVYYSPDNGTSWSLVHDGENVATFYDFEFFDDGSGLICGSQGRMLKYIPEPLGVGHAAQKQPLHFYDPRSKELTLQFSEIMKSLTIYTLDGRTVYRDDINANDYSTNLSMLAEGLYAIKIKGQYFSNSFKLLIF